MGFDLWPLYDYYFCFLNLTVYISHMPHFVYMLECAGNRIYTGYATDVEKRYQKHCEGKGAHFTKVFPPQRILKIFETETKSEALSLEFKIKQLPKPKKELLILGQLEISFP